MRGRSVFHRIERLVDRGHTGDRERLIHEVATETGLDEAEVRAELAVIEEHSRRYGPSTIEQEVRRIADDLDLAEDEVCAEYERITGASGGRP